VQRTELLEYRIEVLARRQAGEDDLDGITPILRRGLLLRCLDLNARSKGSTLQISTASRW
jgi:hypothetical protein